MSQAIIIDYFRRWRTVIILCSLAQVVTTILQTEARHAITFPFMLFLGGLSLSLDLSRGLARPMLMLPISTEQLTKSWWTLGVALPTLWTILLAVGSRILALVWFPNTPIQVGDLAGQALGYFTLYSVVYFALTGLPSNPAPSQSGLKGILFGIIFGFSIGGSWFFFKLFNLSEDDSLSRLVPTVILAITFAILGYQRTPAMLMSRATGRGTPVRRTEKRWNPMSGLDIKLSGFPYFALRLIPPMLIISVIFLVSMTASQLLLDSTLTNRNRAWNDHFLRSLNGPHFFIIFAPSLIMATKLMNLKTYRCLPYTAAQLSLRLIGLTASVLVLQITALSGLVWLVSNPSTAATTWKDFSMVAGLGCLMIPVFIRYGYRPTSVLLMLPVFFVAATSGLFFKDQELLSALSPWIGLSAALLAWYSTWRILAHSSGAYRQTNTVSPWQPMATKM